MKNSLRQFDRTPANASACVVSHRSGFTMIELLIAVAILIILTTLTVSAFNVNDADRVGNSVGTFKNALEGARSRAIKSGEVRGLRLQLDPNDNHIVTSMVYVGSAGIAEQQGVIVYEPSENRWIFGSNNTTEWEDLIDNGLITRGLRVEIPSGSGRWYTVSGGQKDYSNMTDMIFTAGNREVLFLSEQYYPNRPTILSTPAPGTLSYAAVPTSAVTVGLELSPTTLDGSDPILLDKGTCIDLDGSRLPGSWRVFEDKFGSGGVPPRDRTFDTSVGDVDEDGDGQFDYVGGYNTMDILFSPDGTLTGTARTSGVMNFHFAYISDVAMFQANRQIPQGDSFPAFTTYSLFMVSANPEKGHKVLTVFPQTGGVIISDIDPTADGVTTSAGAGNGFNNQYASSPFSYALDGKESN